MCSSFTGSTGTWELIGSESTLDSEYSRIPVPWPMTSIGTTLDTFINRATGKYKTMERREVYQAQNDKKIWC